MKTKKIKAKRVAKEVKEQVALVVQGDTVLLTTEGVEGKPPRRIEIQVYEGENLNANNMPMQRMGGEYQPNGIFSVYNTVATNRKPTDGALTDEIFAACRAIESGEMEVDNE